TPDFLYTAIVLRVSFTRVAFVIDVIGNGSTQHRSDLIPVGRASQGISHNGGLRLVKGGAEIVTGCVGFLPVTGSVTGPRAGFFVGYKLKLQIKVQLVAFDGADAAMELHRLVAVNGLCAVQRRAIP